MTPIIKRLAAGHDVADELVVTVFGCGPVAAPARSWVQPVASDRVIVHCNDSDAAWTLACDGDVWRSTAVAVTNCSTTAALTGDTGALCAATRESTRRVQTPTKIFRQPNNLIRYEKSFFFLQRRRLLTN